MTNLNQCVRKSSLSSRDRSLRNIHFKTALWPGAGVLFWISCGFLGLAGCYSSKKWIHAPAQQWTIALYGLYRALEILATWHMTTWCMFDLRCPKRRRLRVISAGSVQCPRDGRRNPALHHCTARWNRAERNRALGESDPVEISGRKGSAQLPSDSQRPLAQFPLKCRRALFCKCSRAPAFDRRPQRHAYL